MGKYLEVSCVDKSFGSHQLHSNNAQGKLETDHVA